MKREIEPLLPPNYLMPLDAGVPNEGMRAALQSFRMANVVDESMAQACRAGLWLYHNFLDESHRISQEIDTPTGSFWHAIMHRREGDFGNAKYWFRRVGDHPVNALLEDAAASLGWKAWDAFAFVDLCERNLSPQTPKHTLCQQAQQAEWQVLFDWCYRKAVG